MVDPKQAFETRLLGRVAQAVEAGEVPAHLIIELQEEIIEAGGRTREHRLAAWAREELVLRDPQPARRRSFAGGAARPESVWRNSNREVAASGSPWSGAPWPSSS